MVNSIPSKNPNNTNSLSGTFAEVLRKEFQKKDSFLPAEVISYEYDTVNGNEWVRVKPLISVLKTDNTTIDRAEIPRIPVKNFGGNGFFMRFYLPEGSLGWIQASDRDMSIFLNSYKIAGPNTTRMHSFEDATFCPDIMHGYTIADEDQQAAVLQNLDGTVKISLTNDRIKISSPLLEIVSTTNITGDVNIVGNIDLTGNIDQEGNITQDGDIDSTGTITGDTDVIADGISLKTHMHSAGAYLGNQGTPITGLSGEPE